MSGYIDYMVSVYSWSELDRWITRGVSVEIDNKAVAYFIGAIFAIFGCLMLLEGGRAVPANEQLVSTGWLLVILAAAIWGITLIAKKL